MDNGIELTLVSNPGAELDYICRHYSVRCHPIEMSRVISPFRDLTALVHLHKFLKMERFDIVHSSTPKAGLLAAMAAKASRTQIYIHTYTGQRWVEMRGLARLILRYCDKLVGRLSTRCYADSASQRDFLISEGLVRPDKISVVANGSISGVDLERFSPERWRANFGDTKAELNIPDSALVILFVGRVTRDKGISELINAFQLIETPGKDIHLVLVGPFEPDYDPLPPNDLKTINQHPRIHNVGPTRYPEKYMGIADLFCLPSYREGFGSVIIEAAAMGVPAVATRIVGLTDAVVDGETGILVPVKDSTSLADGLRKLLRNDKLREKMGESAKLRTQSMFDADLVNKAVVQEVLESTAPVQTSINGYLSVY